MLGTHSVATGSLFREVSTYFRLTGTPYLPALPKVQMSDNLNTGHLNQPFIPPVGNYWLVLAYRSGLGWSIFRSANPPKWSTISLAFTGGIGRRTESPMGGARGAPSRALSRNPPVTCPLFERPSWHSASNPGTNDPGSHGHPRPVLPKAHYPGQRSDAPGSHAREVWTPALAAKSLPAHGCGGRDAPRRRRGTYSTLQPAGVLRRIPWILRTPHRPGPNRGLHPRRATLFLGATVDISGFHRTR